MLCIVNLLYYVNKHQENKNIYHINAHLGNSSISAFVATPPPPP